MRILSVTVGGFRNVARTTIELGGMVALVSPNNFGKSNLLDALAFATSFMAASPRRRDTMMSRVDVIPLVNGLADTPFEFLVEIEDDGAKPEYRYVRYGFSLAWFRDDGTGQRILDETLQASPNRQRWTSFLQRDCGRYRKSKDTRSFRRVSLDSNQLAIDVLTAIDNIDINHTVRSIQKLSLVICSTLDASQRFEPLPIDFSWDELSESDLILDDRDLPRALYRLKTIQPSRYQDFLYAVYTLFPTFRELSVDAYELRQDLQDQLSTSLSKTEDEDEVPLRIRDEMYKVTVHDENLNQPVDVSWMSTGTKRLIWLVANLVIAGEVGAGCVGVEEVETSIHPRMLRTLLETLEECRRDTALIMTSHSPYLVQYLKPRQLYVGIPSGDGVARFGRIRDGAVSTVVRNAHDRGVGYGDYLFELMSDDGDGCKTLEGYLERP